ncbi:MAG: head fiber protein [Cetobacterium sp.]|uniref:head fiber protein n=1 Tax=Cetobacterium sp. TaxID=2071632 RepID=UPI003F3EDFB3
MPKEKRQIKEITDNDLDTGRDLVTENYELEILTLKDKVDLRRFSRSFLKVDKLLKNAFTSIADHIAIKVSQIRDGHMSKEDKVKLDNIADNANNYSLPVANSNTLGGVKIGNGINIDSSGTISIIPAREGLVPIGALLLLDNANNPALMFPGTTWNKIEERFLYGTSGATGQLGGRNVMSLTIAQMPRHNHSAWTDQQGNHNHGQDAHLHSQPPHTHEMPLCFGYNGGSPNRPAGNSPNGGSYPTHSAGGENTGGAQPTIHYAGQHGHNVGVGENGSGEAFNIMPQYYTVNIWKRAS